MNFVEKSRLLWFSYHYNIILENSSGKMSDASGGLKTAENYDIIYCHEKKKKPIEKNISETALCSVYILSAFGRVGPEPG